MKKKNVTILIGVETVRDSDGVVKKFSETFLNNAQTWIKDHPETNVVIVNSLEYIENVNPLQDVWEAVCKSHDKIDTFIYFGHSSEESLIVYSHTLTERPLSERWFRAEFHYEAPFAEDAEIFLYGCQTGGVRGVKLDDSLAQIIANRTDRIVWAYVSRSYQIQKGKRRFYQISDDKIGFVKFTKNNKDITKETSSAADK